MSVRGSLPETLFPQRNEIWESVDQCELDVQDIFAAPAVSAAKLCSLRASESASRTAQPNRSRSLSAFVSVRFDELHNSLVPQDVRSTEPYTSYSLSARTAYFNEHFRLVETDDTWA